jgi:hypothetical protein
MDADGSQSISFDELCWRLRRLDFSPPVHITSSDFATLTQNGTLCNANGEMSPDEFELAMRLHLRLFVQVRATFCSRSTPPHAPPRRALISSWR